MSVNDPLPFRLRIPGDESVDLDGQEVSVTYRLHGLLRLLGDALAFEWIVRRRTETDSLTDGDVQVDDSPVGAASVPLTWIARAEVRGGWWSPRLQILARRIDAFEDIPGVRPGSLTLRIRRQDRQLAGAITAAIAAPRDTAKEPAE